MNPLRPVYRPGIPYIKLPGLKRRTILDERHCCIINKYRMFEVNLKNLQGLAPMSPQWVETCHGPYSTPVSDSGSE